MCIYARLHVCIGPHVRCVRFVLSELGGVFVLCTFLGIALDRRWYRVLPLHDCNVVWGCHKGFVVL